MLSKIARQFNPRPIDEGHRMILEIAQIDVKPAPKPNSKRA